MPAFLVAPVAGFLARLLTKLLPKFRRLVEGNLAAAFPELTPEEQKRLVMKTLSTVMFNALLLGKWYRMPKERIDRFVELRGKEILDGLTGRPLVAVCAHLGFFPLFTAYLQWQGYPLRYVGRHANNPFVNRMVSRMLARREIRFYDKKDMRSAVRAAGQWLAAGNILCLHSDQYSGEGVRVKIFGHDTCAPTGAAVFARKHRCPVIGIFIEKGRGFRQVIRIEGPYPLRHTEDREADIKGNTQFFFDRFAHFVRRHPEEWFTWTSRIFR